MKKIFSIKREHNVLKRVFESYLAIYIHRLSGKNNAVRGQRMAVYANDWVGINVTLFGFYEGDELSTIFKWLSPLNSVFNTGLALDIGANVGNHAIFFDKYFSKTLAFEPNPATYDLLKFNARYSKAITPFNYGLGDVQGEFGLSEDGENFGAAYLHSSENQDSKVRVERLDDIGLDLGGLSLIKLDVEGFEANVVRGARDTIMNYQPLILFEQQQSEFNKEVEPETLRLLRELGYVFCWIRQKTVARTWLGRRVRNLIDIFSRSCVEEQIVSALEVPPAQYSLLIAVPQKYHTILGV